MSSTLAALAVASISFTGGAVVNLVRDAFAERVTLRLRTARRARETLHAEISLSHKPSNLEVQATVEKLLLKYNKSSGEWQSPSDPQVDLAVREEVASQLISDIGARWRKSSAADDVEQA